MIVITGPTGNIGSRVLELLLATNAPTRVVVRDPARLPDEARARVEVVVGSHGDADVIARAIDGADALFWLLPSGNLAASSLEETYVGFTRPLADALPGSGVQRVVDVSALGRGTEAADHAGNVTASLAMDDLIASTGVAFRVLTCPSFMDNTARQVQAICDQGVMTGLYSPDLPLPLVATRDIGAVAARLLLDETWTGREEVPLLGPEDLSQNDLARIVSGVLGTTVRYQQVPPDAFRERMLGVGMSEPMVQGLLDMADAKYQHGLDSGVRRTPEHAVETPTTFREWCERVLAPASTRPRPAATGHRPIGPARPPGDPG